MANPKFKIGDKVKIHSGRGVANIAYVSSMDAYCGDEKFDSKGEIFSEFNSLKQITVMEVKEG